MIELTRCGAPDNDRYLPAVMTQGDASTYQTMIDNSTMQKRSQQISYFGKPGGCKGIWRIGYGKSG